MGGQELLIILAILLVLFGASRVPALARSMGRSTHEFKKGLKEGGTEESIQGPCPFCSTEVPDGSKFCPGCGRSGLDITAQRTRLNSQST
jgi:TatA/E family protein of Tat protein translocase